MGGDTAQILKCFRDRGGTPHIPIEGIWSYVKTKVGTPHKIPVEGIWSNDQIRVGTQHKILRCFRSRGGTPHIPIEGIWSYVKTKVGTPHKI